MHCNAGTYSGYEQVHWAQGMRDSARFSLPYVDACAESGAMGLQNHLGLS